MIAFLKRHRFEILVFVFFVLTRTPSLGHDTFNTDVWKWKVRSYDFGSGVFGLEFNKTFQKYHPGVTLMWLGSVGVKVYNLYYDIARGHPPLDNVVSTIFELHTVQKYLIVLTLGLLISSIFYVIRRIYGYRYAVLSIVLLALEPFYIGLTRVFHLEGLMTTFMLASYFWLIYYLKYPQKKWRLGISAFFTACAVLTKTSALYMLPFLGLVMFLDQEKTLEKISDKIKEIIPAYMVWLGSFALFFFVLWPAMWIHPLQVLDGMYRGISEIGIEGDHIQYYLGRLVDDPGISYYFVVFVARSSMVLLTGLAGVFFIIKKLDKKRRSLVLQLLLFGFLYLLIMSIPSKKLDRYLLPTVVSTVFVSAIFFEHVLERILKWFGKEKWVGWYLALTFLLSFPAVVTIYRIHPDYFSYYSPLVGGLKSGIYVIEPKWVIGRPEVIDFFTQLKKSRAYEHLDPKESFDHLLDQTALEPKLVIGIPEKYFTQIWPFVREMGAGAVIKDVTAHANNSDFFVYPVWADDSAIDDRYKLVFVDSIKVRGVPVYNVYERWFIWQWNEMQAAKEIEQNRSDTVEVDL